jgi:hypothetical protein
MNGGRGGTAPLPQKSMACEPTGKEAHVARRRPLGIVSWIPPRDPDEQAATLKAKAAAAGLTREDWLKQTAADVVLACATSRLK